MSKKKGKRDSQATDRPGLVSLFLQDLYAWMRGYIDALRAASDRAASR